MNFQVRKAERKQKKLKALLQGPSGSGKTYTALRIAEGFNQKTLVIDSEDGAAEMYADEFEFDILQLPDTDANTYVRAVQWAGDNGYGFVIIDSLSHAWEALLELKEQISRRGGKNSFTAWSEVTPIYNKLVNAVTKAPLHVICTVRSKTEYVLEEVETDNGRKKTVPKRVGMSAIFRNGGEYEFDLVASIDLDHSFSVEKTRIKFLTDHYENKPGPEFGVRLKEWLEDGKAPPLPREVPLSKPTDVHKTVGDLVEAGLDVLTAYMVERKNAGDGTAEELEAGKVMYDEMTSTN